MCHPGPVVSAEVLERRLHQHLNTWLGQWPPTPAGQAGAPTLTVVGSPRRRQPAWNGEVYPLCGVSTPAGAVLSVPPELVGAVRAGNTTLDQVTAVLPERLGRPEAPVGRGVFRWCHRLQDGPDAGEWIDPNDRRVPSWLAPFNGDVLVAWDDEGHYAAGVGRKIHDPVGQEISVGTAPEQRGRGLAHQLVAQAARRIAADGGVATYLHGGDNYPSAHVAEAAGFPDEGWHVIGLPTVS